MHRLSCCGALTQQERISRISGHARYPRGMKLMAFLIATGILAGCASNPGWAEVGSAVHHASDGARTLGAGAGSGSVASGGTGYLPCPLVQGTSGRRAECH